MSQARLEHVNVTVSDPVQTANRLCALFDWCIRWRGDAIHDGETIHVGSDDDYIAVYAMGPPADPNVNTYQTRGGLNHVGVVVEDLDAVEARVIEAGYTPFSHGDYEPGRRFYFKDSDEIEFEVVSYTSTRKPA